jgi:hypothetical protein
MALLAAAAITACSQGSAKPDDPNRSAAASSGATATARPNPAVSGSPAPGTWDRSCYDLVSESTRLQLSGPEARNVSPVTQMVPGICEFSPIPPREKQSPGRIGLTGGDEAKRHLAEYVRDARFMGSVKSSKANMDQYELTDPTLYALGAIVLANSDLILVIIQPPLYSADGSWVPNAGAATSALLQIALTEAYTLIAGL